MRYLLIILLLMPFIVPAQDRDLPLVRQLKGSFTDFGVDNLGNIYAITAENQMKKFNVKGDSMGVFNDVRRYGKLTSIQASNPLRTLLYYGDFRTVLVLDRLLNRVNLIDLRKINIFQVKVVAPAYDNNIWVFDEQESKLKKVGEDGSLISETADLRLVLDEAPMPTKMYDHNGYVYLYDPAKGLFVFDYYGALKNKVALLDWSDVQVIGTSVVGRNKDKVLNYTPGTLEIREAPISRKIADARDIQITPLGIYVLTSEGIDLYSFTGF